MIKPLNAPQLSSAKPRCGLQKISDLLPRLIRQYELQAELAQRSRQPVPPIVTPTMDMDSNVRQATFGWYE